MPIAPERLKEVLRVRFQIDLENLRECNDRLEGALAVELTRLEDRLEAKAARLEEEDNEWLADHYVDERWQLSTVFPQTLRRALFVACHSMVGHALEVVCANMRHSAPCAVTLSDLKGRGLKRYRTFLKKVVSMPFPDGSDEWRAMLEYAVIRNVIVHADGNVRTASNTPRAKSAVAVTLGASLDDRGTIMLSREFLRTSFDRIEAFLTLVLDSIA